MTDVYPVLGFIAFWWLVAACTTMFLAWVEDLLFAGEFMHRRQHWDRHEWPLLVGFCLLGGPILTIMALCSLYTQFRNDWRRSGPRGHRD